MVRRISCGRKSVLANKKRISTISTKDSRVKWLRWYIILMALLLGIYMYAVYKRPPEIDWNRTLSNRDKIPFGTYILFNNLKSILYQKPQESLPGESTGTTTSTATTQAATVYRHKGSSPPPCVFLAYPLCVVGAPATTTATVCWHRCSSAPTCS